MSIEGKLLTIAENEQKVYNAGAESAHTKFWDVFLDYGNRTNYNRAFSGQGWKDAIFNPKYVLFPVAAEQMFYSSQITKLSSDMIDWSRISTVSNMFATSVLLKEIEKVDLMTSGLVSVAANIFDNCVNLNTIGSLYVLEKCTFSNSFRNCSALRNITVYGTIGNNISFQNSPLSKKSIESVVNALSTNKSGLTLTLRKTAVNAAFDINVDDTSTYPEGSEFYNLRNSKVNWNFVYA